MRFVALVFLAAIQAATPSSTSLDTQVRAIARGFQGDIAMAARNLTTGQSVTLNGDKRVKTASTIKVAVMAEAFFQIKEGKLHLNDPITLKAEERVQGSGILQDLQGGLQLTLEDAITLMIVESDNTATNLVLDRVGVDNVNKRTASLGLPNTKVFKKVFVPLNRPLTDEEKEFGLGSTTPNEILRLLEMIDGHKIVDAASCDRMIAILKKQRDLNSMQRYLMSQPNVTIASKSGALDDMRADVGLVYTPSGTLAMAVYAYNINDRRWTADNAAPLTIAKLAWAVYHAWVAHDTIEHSTVSFDMREIGHYDLLIRNAHIVDGSGNPWYTADIAVKDGRIARIGSLPDATAKRVIDAIGQVVAPGFIDVHVHVEGDLERIPTADNFIMDGRTTVITGNCGGSKSDIGAYFTDLTAKGISLNLATFIGHNTVRAEVMGNANRHATPAELEKMRQLVAKAMQDGAVGFSTGLIYTPGAYSSSEEVIELGKVAGKYGGIYASHMRDEGPHITEAIEEALNVGRAGKMPVELSHFKIDTKALWGSSTATLAQVEKARREGLEVTVDQYPYTASSTGLGANLIPSWARADGWAKVEARYRDPETRQKIVREMSATLRSKGRDHLDYAIVARCAFDPSLEGRNISEINLQRGRKNRLEDEIETVLDLELQAKGITIQTVYFSMGDEDVNRIMRNPFTMVASDGGIVEFGTGVPHPRSYGTFTRSLGVYVREKQVLTLEDAIRKMTSLPAQTFRLKDRGTLKEGYFADIVIFDPARVRDMATFTKPHQYAQGISAVIVNGEVVMEGGKHTGARPGRVLRGPGFSSSGTK